MVSISHKHTHTAVTAHEKRRLTVILPRHATLTQTLTSCSAKVAKTAQVLIPLHVKYNNMQIFN